jgi:hypothetical protein
MPNINKKNVGGRRRSKSIWCVNNRKNRRKRTKKRNYITVRIFLSARITQERPNTKTKKKKTIFVGERWKSVMVFAGNVKMVEK